MDETRAIEGALRRLSGQPDIVQDSSGGISEEMFLAAWKDSDWPNGDEWVDIGWADQVP